MHTLVMTKTLALLLLTLSPTAIALPACLDGRCVTLPICTAGTVFDPRLGRCKAASVQGSLNPRQEGQQPGVNGQALAKRRLLNTAGVAPSTRVHCAGTNCPNYQRIAFQGKGISRSGVILDRRSTEETKELPQIKPETLDHVLGTGGHQRLASSFKQHKGSPGRNLEVLCLDDVPRGECRVQAGRRRYQANPVLDKRSSSSDSSAQDGEENTQGASLTGRTETEGEEKFKHVAGRVKKTTKRKHAEFQPIRLNDDVVPGLAGGRADNEANFVRRDGGSSHHVSTSIFKGGEPLKGFEIHDPVETMPIPTALLPPEKQPHGRGKFQHLSTKGTTPYPKLPNGRYSFEAMPIPVKSKSKDRGKTLDRREIETDEGEWLALRDPKMSHGTTTTLSTKDISSYGKLKGYKGKSGLEASPIPTKWKGKKPTLNRREDGIEEPQHAHVEEETTKHTSNNHVAGRGAVPINKRSLKTLVDEDIPKGESLSAAARAVTMKKRIGAPGTTKTYCPDGTQRSACHWRNGNGYSRLLRSHYEGLERREDMA